MVNWLSVLRLYNPKHSFRYFLSKKREKNAKASHIFSNKNISVFEIFEILTDGWIDDLQFYILSNSISVISERW